MSNYVYETDLEVVGLVARSKIHQNNSGLEYIVEVHCHEVGRHTIFKCLLCGESVDESNGMWNILQHLHKLSHKLHYLVSLRDLTN